MRRGLELLAGGLVPLLAPVAAHAPITVGTGQNGGVAIDDACYDLTRRRARIPVRLTPRSGRSRTVTLPVRRCGTTG